MREFIKGVCAGNDYVYVEGEPCARKKIAAACDRRCGIGGDGVVFYKKTENGCGFRIFNSDGSEAEFCGNACLTLAKILNLQNPEKSEFLLTCMAGERRVRALAGGKCNLYSPEPVNIVTEFCSRFLKRGFKTGNVLHCAYYTVGNPHFAVLAECVTRDFADEIQTFILQENPFKGGVNIEVFGVCDSGVFVEVRERGSDRTGSCGSGSLCVFKCYEQYFGKIKSLTLRFENGCLLVFRSGKNLVLSGLPEVVFNGVSEVFL